MAKVAHHRHPERAHQATTRALALRHARTRALLLFTRSLLKAHRLNPTFRQFLRCRTHQNRVSREIEVPDRCATRIRRRMRNLRHHAHNRLVHEAAHVAHQWAVVCRSYSMSKAAGAIWQTRVPEWSTSTRATRGQSARLACWACSRGRRVAIVVRRVKKGREVSWARKVRVL
jgi:hypothetical protein